MKNEMTIGEKIFQSKKDALNYYKIILNSYNIGDCLTASDFKIILDLLMLHPNVNEKINKGVEKIRIAKIKYGNKAFEIVRFDSSAEVFSYIKCISSPRSSFTKFSQTCREVVQEDIRNVKQKYFDNNSKKGLAKCQETGQLSKWKALVIDHRQPNTFSIIVERFIEVYKIDIQNIKYLNRDNLPDKFEDIELTNNFRNYHQEKANLRIVRKECNLKRSGLARTKRTSKDLEIDNQLYKATIKNDI